MLGKPSNAAVLREALVQIVALARQDQPRFAIISTAETALSALPRQCDIGTAEEQCQRMFHYCIKKGNCSVCKRRKNMSFRGCILDWAQMPYEEGGAK